MISNPEFESKQIVFVLLNEGEKIAFSNDNIIVRDKEGKIRHQSTCYRLFMLCLIGNISITNAVFKAARKFCFIIVLMSSSMKTYEILGGRMEGNVLLRRKQYAYSGLELAKHILKNKVENARQLLISERNKSEDVKLSIVRLDDFITRIKSYTGELSGLLGLEGLSAREFFKSYYRDIDWSGRKPRIKCDFINSTLDIGYTILFNYIDSLLNAFGFDTYCGVLHREFYMRKSLVCDLVEPFRSLIDMQVRKSVNLKQCQPEDFINRNGAYLLKWENNGKYIGFLMQPILQKKVEIFMYVQSYYRAFMKGKSAKDFPVFIVR